MVRPIESRHAMDSYSVKWQNSGGACRTVAALRPSGRAARWLRTGMRNRRILQGSL